MEVEEQEAEQEVEEIEEEVGEEVGEETPAETQPDDDETGELTVTIGEEEPEEAPAWVKDLRRRNRELTKKVQQYEKSATEKAEPVGEKPNLEKLDYDTERYEQELAAWYERKRRADEREAESHRQQEEQQKAWDARLTHYEESKTALKVKDYEEAEDTAKELFNVTQQGIILQGADNPALLVYALGKNPSKAKELAEITDPVKFSFAIAKLEAQVKKKTPPKPESRVSGTGRTSGAVDSTLERLRNEAAKTGDFTKVHQYKQQKRAKKIMR